MGDGVQPVGDGDGGAALAQMRHRVLHQPLGFGIERGGGLVEQDDRRVLDQRARDRDALALAAGKLRAALADRRVVAGRKRADELVGVRGLGGGDDLGLARAGLADGDVLADRAVEQEHVLADIGDLPAQRAARHAGDVLAVDLDRSGVGLVEPQDQVEHRGLAAAGRPDQRGHLAGLGDEGHAADDDLARPIAEAHVVELDARRR